MREDIQTTIYVVRHGETTGNVRHEYSGHTDVDLTERGELQGKERAVEFANIHFDAVYSSDLIRAKRTAEFIKAERQLEVKTSELLRERNFGHFEGKNRADLIAEYKEEFDRLDALVGRDKLYFKPHETWEDIDTLLARFVTVLREIALANLGKTVLVVCHGSIMRAFLGHMDPKYYHFRFDNTGWFKILSDGVNFDLKETSGLLEIPKPEQRKQ